jgi:hypothetical protein
LNKQVGVTHAMYRGIGSIATVAASRGGLLVGFYPSDHHLDEADRRRAIAPVKGNLGRPQPALVFCLRARSVELDDGHKRDIVSVKWLGVDYISARDLLQGAAADSSGAHHAGERLEEACKFLRKALSDGPKPIIDIEGRAAVLGISDRTLNRARELLGVESYKKGFGKNGAWFVWIPGTKNQPP